MVFSGLLFVYLFLPLSALLYFAFPQQKVKNAVLITLSILFYAWGEPLFVFLLIASAAVNFFFGLLLDRTRNTKVFAWIFGLSITANIALLVVFKYSGFLVGIFNKVFSLNFSVPSLVLPIGISFYSFQTISYLADVYRGRVKTQTNFAKFLLYISLFPQLIAGPIVRYSEIEPQLESRAASMDGIFYGVLRFCVGLGKKVLLANYAGKAASLLLDTGVQNATVLGTWFGMLLFAFEIYFDFSGYSDMAIGLGRIFGFKYNENFNLPYTSKSIREFWRRWHISLGRFFRDYVYIPMGGNRRHQIFNLLVVWSLTGLWHGASLNFLLWGLYFFVLLLLEKLLGKVLDKIPNWLRVLFTFVLVTFGWTLFYYTDMGALWSAVKTMFGAGAFISEAAAVTMLNNSLLLLLCIVGSSRLPRYLGLLFGTLCSAGDTGKQTSRQNLYTLCVFLFDIVILFLCTVSLVGSNYNPFLYFRF